MAAPGDAGSGPVLADGGLVDVRTRGHDAAQVKFTFETDSGELAIVFDPSLAPVSASRFVTLARQGARLLPRHRLSPRRTGVRRSVRRPRGGRVRGLGVSLALRDVSRPVRQPRCRRRPVGARHRLKPTLRHAGPLPASRRGLFLGRPRPGGLGKGRRGGRHPRRQSGRLRGTRRGMATCRMLLVIDVRGTRTSCTGSSRGRISPASSASRRAEARQPTSVRGRSRRQLLAMYGIASEEVQAAMLAQRNKSRCQR